MEWLIGMKRSSVLELVSSPSPDRDCVLHNFLMDPGAMYPEGFHPVQTAYKRDYSGMATHLPRSAVGVKYYFADFGISVYVDPTSSPPYLATGIDGRDRDPPELSDTIPYDPFKLDIFIIGNMLKQEFCDVTNTPRCFDCGLHPFRHSPTLNSFDPSPIG
jgi:hypothetical protein